MPMFIDKDGKGYFAKRAVNKEDRQLSPSKPISIDKPVVEPEIVDDSDEELEDEELEEKPVKAKKPKGIKLKK